MKRSPLHREEGMSNERPKHKMAAITGALQMVQIGTTRPGCAGTAGTPVACTNISGGSPTMAVSLPFFGFCVDSSVAVSSAMTNEAQQNGPEKGR